MPQWPARVGGGVLGTARALGTARVGGWAALLLLRLRRLRLLGVAARLIAEVALLRQPRLAYFVAASATRSLRRAIQQQVPAWEPRTRLTRLAAWEHRVTPPWPPSPHCCDAAMLVR